MNDTQHIETADRVAYPTSPNVPFSTSMEKVDLRDFKSDVLALYEQNGKWEATRCFDWYYRDQGQQTPVSWILRDGTGHICGLCSVTPRVLRYGSTAIRAGVAGNLLIDHTKRPYMGALGLIRSMKQLVVSGELDVLLGIPNHLSEPMFLRLGFQVIDRWATHAFILKSCTLLQSHFGWLGMAVSPFVDFYAAAMRAANRKSKPSRDSFRVEDLAIDQLSTLRAEDWQVPACRIVQDVSEDYLRWRFLEDPIRRHTISSIIASSGKPCAYVVLRHYPERSWIVDCSVDHAQVDEATAISLVCEAKKARSSIWIAHLPSLSWSSQLTSHAFIHMRPSIGGYPDFPLVAFWLPTHALAQTFSRAESWRLFTGFNDV